MKTEFFNEGIGKLKSEFGEKTFGVERSVRIWNAVEDLSNAEFERVLDHILSTFRYPPLPKDFYDAAKAEKAKRLVCIEEAPYQVKCFDCIDTGYLWMKADDNFSTWAFCHCYEGKEQMDKTKLGLPRWEKAMSQVYMKRKFPEEFFKPKEIEVDPKFGVTYSSCMKTALEWNKELRSAERYWRSRIKEI